MQKLKEWLATPEVEEIRKMPMSEILESGFHREPLLPIFVNKEVLFSPAFGVLLYAKRLKSKDEIVSVHGNPFTLKELLRTELYDKEYIVIGIFMTMYDVHVNYMPSSGYLTHKKLPELKIDNISMTKVERELIEAIDRPDPNNMDYLFYNERTLNTIYDNEIGQEYYIIQIADAEVGAIIPFEENDKFIAQGWPFSAVRFGSQVDLVIPVKKYNDYEILVEDKIGWHIDAVKDPLVRITRRPNKYANLIENFNECHDEQGRFCSGSGSSGSGGNYVGFEPNYDFTQHDLKLTDLPPDIRNAYDKISLDIDNTDSEELALISKYTGYGNERINRRLAYGKNFKEVYNKRYPVPISDEEISDTDEDIKRLDNMFNKDVATLQDNIIVYRGINEQTLNRHPDLNKALRTVGSEIEMKPFSSTSIIPFVATTFSYDSGTIMKIKVPAGTKALGLDKISGIKGEYEVLLNRGTKIRVTGEQILETYVKTNGDKTYITTVEVEVVK